MAAADGRKQEQDAGKKLRGFLFLRPVPGSCLLPLHLAAHFSYLVACKKLV